MLKRAVAQLPPGVVDYYFERAQKRRDLEQQLREAFRAQGYSEAITPTFEYFDIFERGMRPEVLNRSYRFFNRDGDLLALRADSTCAVARLVATKLSSFPPPFRLFYVNSVFRKEEPHAGKFSEFVQAGVELIGQNNLGSDFQILQTAITTLQAVGIKHFQINLGHVGFVNSVLKTSSLSPEEKDHIRSLLADRRLPELEIFLETLPVSSQLRTTLLELALLVGKEEIFEKLDTVAGAFDIEQERQYLSDLFDRLKKEKLERFVTLDLGNLKGMSYYTGILFEIFSEGLGFPIASGGRYDQLLQKYGVNWPAVGFSFTLERLEALL